MNSKEKKEERSIWREIIVGIFIAVVSGVIVAYIIQEARFKPQPPTEQATSISQPPTQDPLELLAGSWSGTINNLNKGFSAELDLYFQADCKLNNVCGTYNVPQFPCSGNLTLVNANGNNFTFLEQEIGTSCGSGYEYIQILSVNSISYRFSMSGNPNITTTGILAKR